MIKKQRNYKNWEITTEISNNLIDWFNSCLGSQIISSLEYWLDRKIYLEWSKEKWKNGNSERNIRNSGYSENVQYKRKFRGGEENGEEKLFE